MNQSYKAILSQYALSPSLPTWGDLEGWSRETMFEKYPSISPYTYCANNPMKYVDPTGETLVITGGASSEAVGQLENMTSKKFTLIHNSDNTVTYDGKARNRYDRYLKKVIDNQDITVNIKAEDGSTSAFTDRNGKTQNYDGIDKDGIKGGEKYIFGGAYGGCDVSQEGCVNTYQYVNPSLTKMWDDFTYKKKGYSMFHEFAESFEAGQIALKNGGDPINGVYYDKAHWRAGKYAKGTINVTYSITNGSNVEYNETFKMFLTVPTTKAKASFYISR